MTKKTSARKEPPQQNWRWYWIRTALITVLMFIFVLYFTLPRIGSSAYLWAALAALAILAYFVVSYRLLRR